MAIKVAHLTSAHPRGDTRIFLKECQSLSKAGYSVSLLVADGNGGSVESGVTVYDVGAPANRLNRMMRTTHQLFEMSVRLDFDIYHLHDPELIPIGLKLMRLGKKVIFDSHEDVPKQILGKHYLNKPIKLVLSKVFALYETWACKRFNAIVAATPSIRDKFLSINPNTVDVNNFPMLGELASDVGESAHKEKNICYVGGIAAIRGIREIIGAMDTVNSDSRLLLAGVFDGSDIETAVKSLPGWSRVQFLGWLDREGVKDILSRSFAGLVTLHPLINYVDSLPVKMFEYMSAGLPVIASNFPLWKEIIEGNDCGICVDPLKPNEIANAIDELANNQNQARRMGGNGRRVVLEKYNWAIEERKLIDLYRDLSQ